MFTVVLNVCEDMSVYNIGYITLTLMYKQEINWIRYMENTFLLNVTLNKNGSVKRRVCLPQMKAFSSFNNVSEQTAMSFYWDIV